MQNNTRQLIGLAGLKQSGKSSIGEILFFDFDYARYAFAGPLKRMLYPLGINASQTEDGAAKNKTLRELGILPLDITLRQLLQTLGTEWGRESVHSELWTALAEKNIRAIWQDSPRIVVTDVRYENEAALIRDMGGTVVHIFRPDTDNHGDTHPSEQRIAMQPQDLTVLNNGGLLHLERSVLELVHTLERRNECNQPITMEA